MIIYYKKLDSERILICKVEYCCDFLKVCELLNIQGTNIIPLNHIELYKFCPHCGDRIVFKEVEYKSIDIGILKEKINKLIEIAYESVDYVDQANWHGRAADAKDDIYKASKELYEFIGEP
jgi:DNA-directed RNA polymerase subunit RPC12/RpoP